MTQAPVLPQQITRQMRRHMERMVKKMQRRGRRAYPNRVFYWAYPDRDPETNLPVPLPWAKAHLYETCRNLVVDWAGQGGLRPRQANFTVAQDLTTGLCGTCYFRFIRGR